MARQGQAEDAVGIPEHIQGRAREPRRDVRGLTGREIEVEFSAPTDLQIDGETVKNVTHYAARSYWGEKADALSTSSGAALA